MRQFPDATGQSEHYSDITVRKIAPADVYSALQKGLADVRRAPWHYVPLAVIYPTAAIAINDWMSGNDTVPLLYPLATGIAFLGPIAALGLFEICRRRELGLDASWRHAFAVVRSPSIGPIVAFALLLMVIFLAWLLVAQALYDKLYGGTVQESAWQFAGDLFGTTNGWTLIILGNAIGFLFALLVLGITVVSLPLLLDRPVGLAAAVEISIRATTLNPGPMLLWGGIVAGLLLVGSLPLFAGLAVVMPILGYGTWHLYRAVVTPSDGRPSGVDR